MPDTIVVAGASLAGLRAVEALRREGYGGRIVVAGAETHLPYDRPPMSKELLAGKTEPEQIALRKQPYEDLDADWRLGRRATALDIGNREVELHDGERLPFDGLVIATGATPRTLSNQPTMAGLFTLRTLDDCLAIRGLLDASPERVVVIGAGFIGAEVAATCRGRGVAVTVLEALAAPMVRGVGPVIGEVLGEIHRDQGVDLRCNVVVDGFVGDDHVTGVRLADATMIEGDLVLVAVGVAPETRWLEGSGLTLDNGVVCDETLLAAPGIVAAGDVARWPNPLFDGELMRLEHWTNATEQGVHAAKRLLGDGEPFSSVPFVWSDQYDLKIQTVGRFRGDDEMTIAHGSLEERRFVALFGRGGRVMGAMGFSRPRQVMQYRRMIADRGSYADALASASGS
jgi:3-phenylpropionate/trans-cinnamate dioxygenase ferredoxin reductase component